MGSGLENCTLLVLRDRRMGAEGSSAREAWGGVVEVGEEAAIVEGRMRREDTSRRKRRKGRRRKRRIKAKGTVFQVGVGKSCNDRSIARARGDLRLGAVS